MNTDEIKALFDQQAPNYDERWARMAPVNDGLYFLLETRFSELPSDAHILCVGAGTGKELLHFAKKFPNWQFTAVEPSGVMVEVCRRNAEAEGVAARCHFHEGYLDTLSAEVKYDAATCFLVSHFILDKEARTQLFQQIADRLKPNGILASSDLASDTHSDTYDSILGFWQSVMAGENVTPEMRDNIKTMYEKNVAILPPTEVASIIKKAGFESPVQFYQTGLIHAWFAKRTKSLT